MSKFIQSLESRMLLTATSASLASERATIKQDISAVKSALNAERSVAGSNNKVIRGELRTLSNKTQNRKLFTTLNIDDIRSSSRVLVAQTRYLAKADVLSNRAVADGDALLRNPTNARLKARVSADVSALNTQVGPLLTALQSANATAVSTYDTDLNAISAANSSSSAVTSSVQTAQSGLQASSSSYNAAASKVQTDVGALATDLSTLTA